MKTLLLANNAILLRALARHLAPRADVDGQQRQPEWLLTAGAADSPTHRPDFALLDCSGTDADPGALIEALSARISPRRWLLIAPAGATELACQAALLGASGCLFSPVSVDLLAAAVAMVCAGGVCFPRTTLGWRRPAGVSSRLSNFLLPGSTASG